MGYQFLHVECYARAGGKGKAGGHSVASVLAEASRSPEACPHVESPQPPVVLYGDLDQVGPAATAWAEQAKDARGHRLRKDGHCLLAGVISAPPDLADWPGYRAAVVEFLGKEYGDRLRCVIEHTDEKERHVHFYAVPRAGDRFESLHRGKAAAAVIKKAGGPKGAQNRAYKSAMREWQDEFWEKVSSRHGLARTGPRRRRLTRAGWRAEQRILDLLACEDRNKEATAEQLEELLLEVSQLKKEVTTLKTYKQFCERYELDTSKPLSKKEYREYQEQLDILKPRRAQKSPEPVATEKGGGSLDALKKSSQRGLKQPSPAKKKPQFSPGG